MRPTFDSARSDHRLRRLAGFTDDHPDVIKAFRAAINEAAPMSLPTATATQSIANKMPNSSGERSLMSPSPKGSGSRLVVETMKQQDMLQGSLDLNELVLP